MERKMNWVLLAGVPVVLCSCDTLRHTFGLTHSRSDEWSIPTTRPLEMPPGVDLVPPRPGAAGPNDVSAKTLAEKKLGAPAQVPSSPATEKEIVSQSVGTNKVNPEIRRVVDEEAIDADGTVTEHLSTLGQRAIDNLSGKTSPRPTDKNPAERQ